MAQISSTIWIFIVILIIGAVIFGLMGTGNIKSNYSGSSTTTSNPTYSPVQQQQPMYGGKRNKKLKSKRMGTTGIYLLLGAVLVGYITAKFV
jgi:hypothetical protein